MATNTYSIIVNRPLTEVFAYMDDVSREREWQPAIKSARVEPEGATTVGTEKHYTSEFMGREVRNTYVAKIFEKNARVVYETTSKSAISATASFAWDEVDGGTKVTMSITGEPKGILKLIPRGVLDKVYEQEIKGALRRLKERLETG